MKANLKNVADMKEFEAVPVGWYHVKVVKAELVENPGKSPFVKTWFEVVSGPHSTRKIFHNFIFTEAALGFMKPFLLAINYDESKEVDIEPREWLNEQLMVLVDHEIYNGKTKERAVGYKSLDEVGKVSTETDKSEEQIPF